MGENELSDVICQLVSIAEDSVDRETFEELDNAGVEIINCLEELQSLREKAEPKKPEEVGKFADLVVGMCSVCEEGVNSQMNYCDKCGTKLDWS